MHSFTEIRLIRAQAVEDNDWTLVALCELALDKEREPGRISDETLARLSERERAELEGWEPVRARDYVETLPAPPVPPEQPEPEAG
jgi:hypothetical protein